MPGRVLLAEDDIEMCRLLAEALREDGHDVVDAGDGLELLDRITTLRGEISAGRFFDVDLIISDIRMPHISGMEVLRRLRAMDHVTPMILITAFGDEHTHAEAYRLGASAVLDKPFDIDEFQQVVREHISAPDPSELENQV
jgi:CheY-like chemotaxis protein